MVIKIQNLWLDNSVILWDRLLLAIILPLHNWCEENPTYLVLSVRSYIIIVSTLLPQHHLRQSGAICLHSVVQGGASEEAGGVAKAGVMQAALVVQAASHEAGVVAPAGGVAQAGVVSLAGGVVQAGGVIQAGVGAQAGGVVQAGGVIQAGVGAQAGGVVQAGVVSQAGGGHGSPLSLDMVQLESAPVAVLDAIL